MKNYLAFFIFLLITIIYLHPFFLGKVDTPVDILNAKEYPWRYYSVDKKVKRTVLWENNILKQNKSLSKNKQFYDLETLPGGSEKIKFNLESDELLLIQLSKAKDLGVYLTFDFKPINNELDLNFFKILFYNKVTNKERKPPIIVYPSFNDKSWFTAYLPLNDLGSIKDLSIYTLEIVTNNFGKNRPASLYLKDLKIACDDYSACPRIHNPYLGDLVQWYTPAREYYSDSLKEQKLAFWNNNQFTGIEFLAESRLGFFHPLYLLIYYLFDHFTAHQIITFLCFLLCGIGAYLLSRSWGLGFPASILCSIVYMFQPCNTKWFSFEHMLMVSATLPFLLIAYDKNLKRSSLLNVYLIISSFLLGMILLSGRLQIVGLAVLFFLLFAVFRFLENLSFYRRDFSKHLFSLVFVFSFAIMIGSVVLIPYYVLFRTSFGSGISREIFEYTLMPIKALATLIYPYYHGFPEWNFSGTSNMDPILEDGFFNNYIYFGLAPLVFSLFACRMFFKDKLIQFFSFVVIFSLLVSVDSPLFYLFKYFIPGFNVLNHRAFLELFSFSVPFLAGIGFQNLLNYFSSLKANVRLIIASALILVSTLDLMYYSSYFLTWSNKDEYGVMHKNGVLEFLSKKQKDSNEPFRVLPFVSYKIGGVPLRVDIAKPNSLLHYKIEELSGYSYLIPKDFYYLLAYALSSNPDFLYTDKPLNLFKNPNIPYPIYNFHSKILDLLNVKYFMVPEIYKLESKETEVVFKEDSVLYKNKDYLPRAFVVPEFIVNYFSDQTIKLITTQKFNPLEYVILKSFPNFISQKSYVMEKELPKLKYDVKFLSYGSDKIALRANVNRPSFLVLGNNLNDSWSVKINDKKDNHFAANLVQRAVYLPGKGDYLIEFYYFPRLFLICFLIMSISVFILVSLVVFLRYKHKNLVISTKQSVYEDLEKVGTGI